MKQPFLRRTYQVFICFGLFSLLVVGCNRNPGSTSKTDNAPALAGTWVLKSKIGPDGSETPISQRFMKLTFNADGTFLASYRGEETQKWIRAGQGGFSYHPPYLNLYWESAPPLTLLLRQVEPERLVIHHGTALTPLKEQEPDDIFVKQNHEKGPTRGQS